MAGSRRTSQSLTVIYWRDIPAQLRAKAGRNRLSTPLPERFMVAVDAAATKAGKTTTDEYIGEWREVTRACGDDLQMELDAEAKRLVESHPPELIRSFVRNGGWRPGGPASESP